MAQQQYSSYAKPPGPQNPGKYPMVGPNYGIYGEQNGYVYNPWTDRYDPDPRQVQAYQESTGQAQPKPGERSTADILLPVAGVMGAGYVASQVGTAGGESLANNIFGTKDPTTGQRVGGFFGSSQAAQPAQAAQAAQPVMGQGSSVGGMLGPRGDAPMVRDVSRVSQGAQSGATVIPQGEAVPPGYTAVGQAEGGAQIAVPTEQVGTDGSVNLGNLAQGALGAYSLYQGYRDYKDGNYAGAGINTAMGAASIGSALGSQMAASALPVLGPIAGAYGIYQTDRAIGSMPQGSDRNRTGAMGGAAAGASIGTAVAPGIGTAIGAGIGALAGLGASMFGSGKDKYQMIRDKGRSVLQQGGILDDKYQGTLADGSKFDFGKDGKQHGKPQFNNPLYGQAAAFGNVLASVEGMSGKGREAMAMLYGNAAVSNAGDNPNTVLDNYRHFFQQRGISYEAGKAQLDQMLQKEEISQDDYNVFVNDLGRIVPPGQPQGNTKGAGVLMGPSQPVPSGPIAQLANIPPVRGPGPAPQLPPRSSTRSPGISLTGQLLPQPNRPGPGGMLSRKPYPL